MEFKFEPLEEFEWVREYEDGSHVLMGQYHPGMTYNCTKEPRHDALRAKCEEWFSLGMIKKTPLGNQRFITINFGES
jgi:hypothetical protein